MRPVLASDGPNGLRLLQEAAGAGTPYGIVLLDLCMPGMDGLQVAREIAADTSLEVTRMLMLSSAGPIDGTDASAAGILACINKLVRQSELHVSLVQLADPGAAKSAELPLAMPTTSGALGRRVLVVEDNHVNQMVAEGVPRKLGYTVEIAVNGVQALAAMRTCTFDAVLMDCHMPGMDGFEATIAWRRDESAGQRLPIIAITAGVQQQAAIRAAAVAAICGRLEVTAGQGAGSELIDSVDELDREVVRAGSALADLLTSRS